MAFVGGGILNNGTLVLLRCTVSDCEASGSGGGIYSTRRIEVYHSTISGNRALQEGGGILNRVDGFCELVHATISGNSAPLGGGVLNDGGAQALFNKTLLNANPGGNLVNQGEVIPLFGYNLSSDAAGGDGGTGAGRGLNGPGDRRNTDPLLGPLAEKAEHRTKSTKRKVSNRGRGIPFMGRSASLARR